MTVRSAPKKILMVCTGNICRSPMAEAVFRHLAHKENLNILVDSAGTHGYHTGERPDHRTLKICAEKGIPAENIRARKLVIADFDAFDLILAMDAGHLSHMLAMAPQEQLSKIHLLMAYAGLGDIDVPDPYYGDMSDFIKVYQMVSLAGAVILNEL